MPPTPLRLPLNGVRVIDLSAVVLGPYASQNLADYGADVIKVESPDGDSTRNTGPSTEPGMGAIFLGVNRGKRSVVIDLKTERGRDVLMKLVATADVFMHSIRPQKLKPLALDADALLEHNPRLIYVGLHGFGEDGPYGGRAAYDDIIQGMSGSAALMAHQTGTPAYFPTIAADKTCGLIATHAILAALFARERTGKGCYVEVPMYEAMAGFNLVEHFYGHHFEPALEPMGYPRVFSRHRRPYPTTDGFICMMPYTDSHWRRFFLEAQMPEAAADVRFANISERTRNIDALYGLAAGAIAQRSTAQWLQACERLEIPAASMATLEELLRDPHLDATGFFRTIKDERMGMMRFPAPAARFDRESLPVRMAPRLGEHTALLLAEIGMAAEPVVDDAGSL